MPFSVTFPSRGKLGAANRAARTLRPIHEAEAAPYAKFQRYATVAGLGLVPPSIPGYDLFVEPDRPTEVPGYLVGAAPFLSLYSDQNLTVR